MTRWPLEDLVDYVRGVAPAEKRTAIEADLAAAAAREGAPGAADTAAGAAVALRRDLELLVEVAAVLRAERDASSQPGRAGGRALGPSADALLAVEAMLGAAALAPQAALPILSLVAITDPQAGLAAGLRSAQLGRRDLEIHSERFDLELSVDTPFDAIDVVVVGRLVRAQSETWSVDRVPAILVGAGQVLATGLTNRFGEFHVAAQSEEDDVVLCLLIAGVGQIRVPIDRRDPLFAGGA
ncbi:MAG TPA: hypothetical protein VMS86_14485 [Thermoanaerobaculia bacterium]|nr:hypothetical protein [Thermoanaerobaculia bacterium]